uniref:Uncharacterized protein n=1 Tax=Romanomermis culicivorax TaxID=13658 RepID=A0A915KJY7_ROMCU
MLDISACKKFCGVLWGDTFAALICIKIVPTLFYFKHVGVIRKLTKKAVYTIRKEIGCCENSDAFIEFSGILSH